MTKVTGNVLCGGKSSRMGKEKGQCFLNHKPLIEYSLNVLRESCDKIVISSNSGEYNDLGYDIVKDLIKDIGPAGGIYSCLRNSETNDNIVLSCDMPLITSEFIKYLIACGGDFDAVLPVHRGKVEPLCGLYRQSCITTFGRLISQGVYKMQEIINHLKCNYLVTDNIEQFSDQDLFTNVNSPDDLIKVESILNFKAGR